MCKLIDDGNNTHNPQQGLIGRRFSMRKVYLRGIAILTAAFFLVCVGEVLAAQAEKVFAGKVFLLKRVPPNYFKKSGGFISFLRHNSIKTVYENEDHTWTFQTMAFFRKPLGDYEVEMVFYDIEDGKSKNARRFVDSYTQYTQDRNTRALGGKAKLTRPSFDANKRYMVVVQQHSSEIAKGYFSTKGISQAQLDQDKRLKHEMKEMEKSMEDLKKKAKEQEEAANKKKNNKAADDLF